MAGVAFQQQLWPGNRSKHTCAVADDTGIKIATIADSAGASILCVMRNPYRLGVCGTTAGFTNAVTTESYRGGGVKSKAKFG